jgi:hypothetical protein
MNANGVTVIPDYDLASETSRTGLLICGCATLCAVNEMPLPKGWHVAGPGSFDHALHTPQEAADVLLRDITTS